MSDFHVLCRLPAEVYGYLYDLGEYPGYKFPEDPQTLVSGEFLRVRDINKVLKLIDSIEGFYGYGHKENLFVRKPTYLGLSRNQKIRMAWIYEYNKSVTSEKLIESGSWRK